MSDIIELQLDADSKVSAFRNVLQTIRAEYLNAVQSKKGLVSDISELVLGREETINNFYIQAKDAYFDFDKNKADEILSALPASHPLSILWSKYESKINEIDSVLAERLTIYNIQNDKTLITEADHNDIMNMYSKFEQSVDAAVPSPEVLDESLNVDSKVLEFDPGDMFAKITALDLVSPSVAFALIKQVNWTTNKSILSNEEKFDILAHEGPSALYQQVDCSKLIPVEEVLSSKAGTLKVPGILALIVGLYYLLT